MGSSPSNGTPLFRFSGRFIPISRPTPINAGRGALRRPQRQQRPCERCVLCGPQYLITGAMTLSKMAVLAMDEILLRTEISRMRKEGTRRRASERARHGHGRDRRGPPATGTAAQARRTKVFRRPRRWASERGSVPHPSPCRPTASRDVLHRRATSPRTYSRTPPRDAAPPQDEISPRNNLRSRRAAWRDTFGRNELRPP